MSDSVGKKSGALSEARAWLLVYERLKRIDREWEDQRCRLREIDEARRFISGQTGMARLQALGGLMHGGMDRRALWTVLVPVERAVARARVTDAELLEGDSARGDVASVMPATVILDSLRSALNLGGILRCCECFGFEGAVLCGYTAEAAHPRVARSAMGCETLVPCKREDDVCEAIARLKEAGVCVVALETTATAVEVGEYGFEFPCAVVVGNERFGLTPSALEMCDGSVSISMHGRKNSLNVGSAFAGCACRVRQCFGALAQ